MEDIIDRRVRETIEINTRMYALDAPIRVTDENIDDIMCAALEGGICYWCSEAKVSGEYLGEYGHEQISRGGELLLYDFEEGKTHTLNRKKFLLGVQLFIKNKNINYINNGQIDTTMIDGSCADTIIQYAIFGDVIYA